MIKAIYNLKLTHAVATEARCLPVARLHSFKVPGQKHATHEESAGFRGSVPDALVNSHPLYASVCVRLPVT